MTRRGEWVLAVLLALGGACSPSNEAAQKEEEAALAERAARFDQAATRATADSLDQPIALWKLPDQLAELSGLALTRDGHLLTHGDEQGLIFEVDYKRGVISKTFKVGSPVIKGDFEAIAMLGDTVLLMTRKAEIFRFPQGADDATVPYTVVKTGLGDHCEFEAMTVDSARGSLLLACKDVFDKPLNDQLVIYRLPLRGGGGAGDSMLTIPLATIIGSNGWKTLHPSDIAINPVNGNYVVIASIEKVLFEITPTGGLVFARALPDGHEQAEGLAISPDHLLFIGDEAKGKKARITTYRWP